MLVSCPMLLQVPAFPQASLLAAPADIAPAARAEQVEEAAEATRLAAETADAAPASEFPEATGADECKVSIWRMVGTCGWPASSPSAFLQIAGHGSSCVTPPLCRLPAHVAVLQCVYACIQHPGMGLACVSCKTCSRPSFISPDLPTVQAVVPALPCCRARGRLLCCGCCSTSKHHCVLWV